MTRQHTSLLPIQAYYERAHAVLGLYLSNRCNIQCRHCGVNSGPRERTRLSIEIIVNQLGELAQLGVVKALHVSGGEPFLFQKDLRILATAAYRYGLAFGVNTNAFWATDTEKASQIIRSIAGLTQLFLSTDVYHQEFLPLDRVVHAARAGVIAGLWVYVGICAERGEHTDTVDRIKLLLGDEVADKVYVGTTPVELGGRASGLPEARWRREITSFPRGACKQINRPVVLENGNVFACCNTTVADSCKESPLVLGNVFGNSLSTMLARAREHEILQVIRLFGPAVLAELLPAAKAAMLSGKYLEGDICSLCSDMMSNPEVIAELRSAETCSKAHKLVLAAEALGLLHASGFCNEDEVASMGFRQIRRAGAPSDCLA